MCQPTHDFGSSGGPHDDGEVGGDEGHPGLDILVDTALVFTQLQGLGSKYNIYCEIIWIHWTFTLMFFVGRAIHIIKIPMKFLFTSVILKII